MGKARRLAQRVRRRGEPGPPGMPPGSGEGDGPDAAAPGAPQGEPGPSDDAAARIDAARARLRATIEPPADPDT